MPQTVPFGPSAAHQEHGEPQSSCSFAFTIGAADKVMSTIFNCGYARQIYCNAAGNVAIKRANDTVFNVYAVLQGTVLSGHIIAVGGTGSGSSAIAVVAEV